MAIRTIEELTTLISNRIGDENTDEDIALMEDVADTLNDLSVRSDGTDWKAKYEENDKAWREKYRARFNKSVEAEEEQDEEDEKPLTYENLFKDGE